MRKLFRRAMAFICRPKRIMTVVVDYNDPKLGETTRLFEAKRTGWRKYTISERSERDGYVDRQLGANSDDIIATPDASHTALANVSVSVYHRNANKNLILYSFHDALYELRRCEEKMLEQGRGTRRGIPSIHYSRYTP